MNFHITRSGRSQEIKHCIAQKTMNIWWDRAAQSGPVHLPTNRRAQRTYLYPLNGANTGSVYSGWCPPKDTETGDIKRHTSPPPSASASGDIRRHTSPPPPASTPPRCSLASTPSPTSTKLKSLAAVKVHETFCPVTLLCSFLFNGSPTADKTRRKRSIFIYRNL